MRTEMGNVAKQSNGKWCVSFTTFCGTPGSEYVANTCTSAPVFSTEDLAYNAGERALNILESTGKWPNMCEVW